MINNLNQPERDSLVLSCYPKLVIWVVKKLSFSPKYGERIRDLCHRGMKDDLIQVGYEALVTASVYFDSNGGAKFSTYATKCVVLKIRDWLLFIIFRVGSSTE